MPATLERKDPYAVKNGQDRVKLLVMNATDGLPAAFAVMGTSAEDKVGFRISGGCAKMTPKDKLDMIDYFAIAFDGYRGMIWSGGTRQLTEDGLVDPMVTEIPGVIAAGNPGCVALGTIPRVELLSLQRDSRLILDQYGAIPNPTMRAILIVQDGPEKDSEWNGDVDTYLRYMKMWVEHGGFRGVGMATWNGGGVTTEEIMKSAKNGWPTILVNGSGRASDEIAAKLEAGDAELLAQLPANHKLIAVSKENPNELRSALIEYGFIRL